METWKDIPGHPAYEVSNMGRCRWKISKKMLNPHKRRNYLSVNLRADPTLNGGRRCKRFLIHRLVLMAFVGPCPLGYETLHRNGNHHDNRLENLKWGSHAENMEDNQRLGATLRGEESPCSRLTEQAVRAIRAIPQPFTKALRKEILQRYGISLATLYRVKNRGNWTHI